MMPLMLGNEVRWTNHPPGCEHVSHGYLFDRRLCSGILKTDPGKGWALFPTVGIISARQFHHGMLDTYDMKHTRSGGYVAYHSTISVVIFTPVMQFELIDSGVAEFLPQEWHRPLKTRRRGKRHKMRLAEIAYEPS